MDEKTKQSMSVTQFAPWLPASSNVYGKPGSSSSSSSGASKAGGPVGSSRATSPRPSGTYSPSSTASGAAGAASAAKTAIKRKKRPSDTKKGSVIIVRVLASAFSQYQPHSPSRSPQRTKCKPGSGTLSRAESRCVQWHLVAPSTVRR